MEDATLSKRQSPPAHLSTSEPSYYYYYYYYYAEQMFTLCSTTESVSQALDVLVGAEYVILDCEGRDLGTTSGALSLISLGTPHASNIYLFDVLALPQQGLELLFNTVLSGSAGAREKTKVVWDGRMDYAELFFSHSCPIENVLDLQLADILSRAKRGQSDGQRLSRLAKRTFPMSQIRNLQLEEVHALNGMDGVAREHGISGVERKNVFVKKLHQTNLSQIWMERPLSNEFLEYAASDIRRIAGLYDHFIKRGYLEPMDHLQELSAHYVSMYRTSGKPEEKDIFLKGPYLPLSIPLSVASCEVASVPSRDCSRCTRTIPERHFPFERDEAKVGRNADVDGDNQPRSSVCKVCTLILAKAEYTEKEQAFVGLVERLRQMKN